MNKKILKIFIILILLIVASIVALQFIRSTPPSKQDTTKPLSNILNVKKDSPHNLVKPTPASSKTSSEIIESVSIEPSSKVIYDIGEQIQIRTNLNDKFKNKTIQYTLLESCDHQAWETVEEWSSLETIKSYKVTKPGICSLQINVQDSAGNQDAKWIGQYTAGQPTFVETITWEPKKEKYKKGESISFIMQPEVNNADYEFQIQTKKRNSAWDVELPWQSGPLPPFLFESPGMVSIQINIRKPDNPTYIQYFWLGQFFVSQFK